LTRVPYKYGASWREALERNIRTIRDELVKEGTIGGLPETSGNPGVRRGMRRSGSHIGERAPKRYSTEKTQKRRFD